MFKHYYNVLLGYPLSSVFTVSFLSNMKLLKKPYKSPRFKNLLELRHFAIALIQKSALLFSTLYTVVLLTVLAVIFTTSVKTETYT